MVLPSGPSSRMTARVRDALPEGTEAFADGMVDEILPPTPNVLLLVGPDGGDVVHLTTIEVAEADLALLAEFADALDRAAGPPSRPGVRRAHGGAARNRASALLPVDARGGRGHRRPLGAASTVDGPALAF
ncbi:hypothetical protein GCM10020227_68170 [Streptomyces flavovirens]